MVSVLPDDGSDFVIHAMRMRRIYESLLRGSEEQMAEKRRSYGRSKAGAELSNEVPDRMAAEAEARLDVTHLHRRRGRPAMRDAPAESLPVRLDPALRQAVEDRATAGRCRERRPFPPSAQCCAEAFSGLPDEVDFADLFAWLTCGLDVWYMVESNTRLHLERLGVMAHSSGDGVTSDHPRVFLSHASEDKERFVVPFARQLLARGVDPWLDRWEMLPGDSLVRKIFTEGLDSADAVAVVVSAASVTKRWVTEELDAAVVKRIEDDARLVPLVLDGLKVGDLPASIRHLLHIPVALDVPGAVEAAADAVVRAVLGRADKPAIGGLPRYAAAAVATVPGLDRIDALVLKAAGDEAVQEFKELLDTATLAASLETSLDVSEDQVLESLEVLDTDGFIELHRTLGRGIDSMSCFTLTWHGMETYANAFVNDYELIAKDVIACIAGTASEQGTDDEVAKAVSHPRLLVLHVMRLLDAQGLLRLSESLGPWTHYISPSPKLRRLAMEL